MLRRIVALLFLASPLSAQAKHPDFTGTWVLDASKNVVDGPLPAPPSATYVIVQVGDSIVVDQKVGSEMGEMALKKTWKVDGQQWTNHMSYQSTDMVLNSTLKWDGAVLNIHTFSDFAGNPVEQTETWTLGADAKTLTVSTTTNVNGTYYASVTMTLVKK